MTFTAQDIVKMVDKKQNNRTFKYPGKQQLLLMNLDLASLDTVERFVDEFGKKFDKCDILVNNAGVMAAPFSLTNNGFESHFAINHLGHFHLTNLLKQAFASSESKGRIVNVSSGYYRKIQKSIDKGDSVSHIFATNIKEQTKSYVPILAYARSKLANCLHAIAIAKMWAPQGTTIYAVTPGFIFGTRLGRHFNPIIRFIAYPLAWFFSKTVHQGVQTILHCCLEDKSKLKNGALYNNCQMEEYAEFVNEEDALDLFRVSLTMTQRDGH